MIVLQQGLLTFDVVETAFFLSFHSCPPLYRQPNPFEPQTPVEEYTAGLLCALGPLTERVGVVRELLERPPKVREGEGVEERKGWSMTE